MNKVNEELLLAVIFVGKWIALGFGGVGILYFAIHLAYHSTFYDPNMAAFDLEISEIRAKRDKANSKKEKLKRKYIYITNEINQIEKNSLPKAEARIERARLMVKYQGAECLIDLLIPFSQVEKPNDDPCNVLSNAKQERENIEENHSELAKSAKDIKSTMLILDDEIQQYNSDIEEEEYSKRKAEVDIIAPLAWLAGVLGLT